MKIESIEQHEEPHILTGMLVNDSICGQIATKWDGGLFRSKWPNLIGGWAVSYYRKYNRAPGIAIESMFEAWAAKHGDDQATVDLVDRYLRNLSDAYGDTETEINVDYIIDLSGNYFNRVRLEKLAEDIQAAVAHGNDAGAYDLINGWGRLDIGTPAGINILEDADVIRDAFEQHQDPVLTFPGDLGEFIGRDFERDSFLAFMGASGRGKSFWLMDIAWRALRARRRVALLAVGDMSRHQLVRRLMVRAARHPMKPCTLNIPRGLDVVDGSAVVDYESRTWESGLTWEGAWAAVQKQSKHLNPKNLKISVHPSTSLSPGGICGMLDGWARGGWVPDVLIIDYADLLISDNPRLEERPGINDVWKNLRRISQEYHLCLVTATQSDAASYTAHTMTRSNFSENRQKIDHVTGMLGINMTDEEKGRGVYRLNWIKRRDAEHTEQRCVWIAGCLGLASPAIVYKY